MLPRSIQRVKPFSAFEIGEQMYPLPHALGQPRNILTKVGPSVATSRIGLPLQLVDPDKEFHTWNNVSRATDLIPEQAMEFPLVLDIAKMVVLQCDTWWAGQSRDLGNSYFIKESGGYLFLWGIDIERVKVGQLHLSKDSFGWRVYEEAA